MKETDLTKAIRCLSQNYKIFMDRGSGLEPVTLSLADRMAGLLNLTRESDDKNCIYTAGINHLGSIELAFSQSLTHSKKINKFIVQQPLTPSRDQLPISPYCTTKKWS